MFSPGSYSSLQPIALSIYCFQRASRPQGMVSALCFYSCSPSIPHAQAAQSTQRVRGHWPNSQPGKGVRQSDVLLRQLLRWMERSEAVPAPLPLPEVTLSSGCQCGRLHSCSLAWSSQWAVAEKKLLFLTHYPGSFFQNCVGERATTPAVPLAGLSGGQRGEEWEGYLPAPLGATTTGAGMASAWVTTPLLPAGKNCRAQDSNPHTHFSVAAWTLMK